MSFHKGYSEETQFMVCFIYYLSFMGNYVKNKKIIENDSSLFFNTQNSISIL